MRNLNVDCVLIIVISTPFWGYVHGVPSPTVEILVQCLSNFILASQKACVNALAKQIKNFLLIFIVQRNSIPFTVNCINLPDIKTN